MAEARSFTPPLRDKIAGLLSEHLGDNRASFRTASRIVDALELTPLGLLSAAYDAGRMGASGAQAGSVGGLLGGGALLAASALPIGRPLARKAASRMERARQIGFHTDMPLFHGTSREFSAFSPEQGGATSGTKPGRLATWVSLDPGTANEFAEAAAKQGSGRTGQRVLPLLHRADKPAVVHLQGDETNEEISTTLAQAWDDGFDAVMFRNYTTPRGEGGKNILAVRDPAQLRSRFATFDPARRSSRDLLAGIAAGGLLAGALERPPTGLLGE